MNGNKFITIVHNALADASKIDAELKKLGFAVSFKRDGEEVTFPTEPIRLYFMEADGKPEDIRNKYVSLMEDMWKRLNIKAGVASVLVGEDWRV